MSDYLKKLKSIFIVSDEAAPAATEPSVGTNPVVPPAAPMPAARPATPPPVQHAATVQGRVSDKFMQVLADALQQSNIEGVDYFEFRQSLLSLGKINMDEATRYQSAFAMAQAMGATPARLIDTAGHYLGILQQEEAKFQQALVNQQATHIKGREEDIRALAQAIDTKTKQIAQLQQEIQQHQTQMESLRNAAQEAATKMETTKQDFFASYTAIASQIQTDIANMKKYLK